MTFQSPFKKYPFYPQDRLEPVNPWKKKAKKGRLTALRLARKVAKVSRRRNQ